MPDRLEEYLGTVREQVRWKRARDGATQELRTHLLDQRDAWMAIKALKQRGMLGSLIALAVVFTLAAQVGTFLLFNLGLPLFGIISLPFVSYGHWAMLINMTLIGLALSVFREESLPVQNGKLLTTKRMPLSQLIFWKDGDLVIGFSRLRQVR